VTTGGPGRRVGVLVDVEVDVERLEQLAVLVLGRDDLELVAELLTEHLEGLLVHRLGGRDHLTEREQNLHQRGRVGVDLVGEVRQRRAAGQPDRLAVAAWDADAADAGRRHVVELLAPLLLALASTLRTATGTPEGSGCPGATATAGTGTATAAEGGTAAGSTAATGTRAARCTTRAALAAGTALTPGSRSSGRTRRHHAGRRSAGAGTALALARTRRPARTLTGPWHAGGAGAVGVVARSRRARLRRGEGVVARARRARARPDRLRPGGGRLGSRCGPLLGRRRRSRRRNLRGRRRGRCCMSGRRRRLGSGSRRLRRGRDHRNLRCRRRHVRLGGGLDGRPRGRLRRRLAGRLGSRRLHARRGRLLLHCHRRLGRHGVAQLLHHRGLHGGRRRANELTEVVQLLQDVFAVDVELFRELVYPDLCHCSPSRSGSWRPEPSAGVHAHFTVLIERSRSRHCSFGSSVSGGVGVRGLFLQVAPDRGCVHRPGEPEGPAECTSAFSKVQAPQVGVQVRAPTRKATP
jgi:hypothetical protein